MGNEQEGLADKAGEPVSVWDRWPGKLGLPVLTAALGVAATLTIQWYSNRLRFLDYYVTSTSLLTQRPDLGGKQLAVTVDAKPVDNVHIVTLTAVNSSGADVGRATLGVTFRPADGKPLDLLTEDVKPLGLSLSAKATTVPTAGGSIRRDYTYNALNRSVDGAPVFEGQFKFIGSAPPAVEVEVEASNLHARLQSPGSTEPMSDASFWMAMISTFTTGITAGISVSLIFDQRRMLKELRVREERSKDRL